jgi:hypothetical protein
MTDHTFKKHLISEPERLWLNEIVNAEHFDARVAKVNLLGKLPKDFDPKKIDERLSAEGKLTPIGLWHIDRAAPLFATLDKIIRAIRGRIVESPGVGQFTAAEIAKWTELSEDQIEVGLFALGLLGSFYSAATGSEKPNRLTSIGLTGDTAYDEYLRYESVDDLLEGVYISRKPRGRRDDSVLTSLLSSDITERWGSFSRATTIERKSIKTNTAFVLMAIDQEKPDLEDVYTTIKEVCREFGIAAYRADEIEHQDRITDLILREIQTCEFLIADLSYERPNVYYEVGYAHALNKKPILYRRMGTRLHFDLFVHKVPEYKNITELKELLRRRLEAILGRKPKLLNP